MAILPHSALQSVSLWLLEQGFTHVYQLRTHAMCRRAAVDRKTCFAGTAIAFCRSTQQTLVCMTNTWWIAYAAAGLWIIALLGGCQSEPSSKMSSSESSDAGSSRADAQPHYVVTLPVLETLVAPLVEGRATTRTVLAAGDSPHTFDPRPSTVRAARQSQALFYGADVLDGWAAQMEAPRSYAFLDLVPGQYVHSFPDESERATSSGTSSQNQNHTAGEKLAAAHGHTTGTTDPHFWLDPVAVRALVPPLADTLCTVDPGGCDTYQANANALTDSLQVLHEEMETALAPVRDRAFMASQPFLHYLVRRYGLSQTAVVERSPAQEPSARRIQQLIAQARDEDVQVMVRQRQLPADAAQAVAEGASLPVVALDPLGGARFDTYMALMRHNATTLREALTE